MNEKVTKRDVFEDVLNAYNRIKGNEQGEDEILSIFRHRYDNATFQTEFSVPQNVGKWINDLRFWEKSLGDAFDQVYEVRPGLSDVYDWIRANSETFANAWLYGFKDEEA